MRSFARVSATKAVAPTQREMLKELEENYFLQVGFFGFLRVRSGGERGLSLPWLKRHLRSAAFDTLQQIIPLGCCCTAVLANLVVEMAEEGLATTIVKRWERWSRMGMQQLLLQVHVDNIAQGISASQGYVELFCDRAARNISGIFRGDGGGGSGGSGFDPDFEATSVANYHERNWRLIRKADALRFALRKCSCPSSRAVRCRTNSKTRRETGLIARGYRMDGG